MLHMAVWLVRLLSRVNLLPPFLKPTPSAGWADGPSARWSLRQCSAIKPPVNSGGFPVRLSTPRYETVAFDCRLNR